MCNLILPLHDLDMAQVCHPLVVCLEGAHRVSAKQVTVNVYSGIQYHHPFYRWGTETGEYALRGTQVLVSRQNLEQAWSGQAPR